jgi:hypothetical protein
VTDSNDREQAVVGAAALGTGLAFFAVILLGPGLRRVAAIVGHLAAVADG